MLQKYQLYIVSWHISKFPDREAWENYVGLMTHKDYLRRTDFFKILGFPIKRWFSINLVLL